MQSTQSVSEGCFLFKSNEKRKNIKNSTIINETLLSQNWYKTYRSIWYKLEDIIKNVQNEDIESVLKDLVGFVKNSTHDETDNLLPTAILLTGINQSDHYAQFKMISTKIKEESDSKVVILQSRDCTNMKTFIQKLVCEFIDGGDDDDDIAKKSLKRAQYTMQTLTAWYKNEIKTSEIKNLVIILPDFELFKIEVFKKLIIILCSYRQYLPLVIVIGVASLSTLQTSLPYRVTYGQKLQVFKVQSSPNSFNRIIEQVLFSAFCPIQLSGKALQSLVDIFLCYDFSVNGFIQALKQCVLLHYQQGNIYSLCTNEDTDELIEELSHSDLELIRRLPSCRRYLTKETSEKIIGFFLYDDFLRTLIKKFLIDIKTYWYKFYLGLHILYILIKDLPQSLMGKQLRELYCMCMNKNIMESSEFAECWKMLSLLSKKEFLEKIEKIINFTKQYTQLIENSDNNFCSTQFNDFRTILKEESKKVKIAGTETSIVVQPYEHETTTKMSRHNFRDKILEQGKQKKPESNFFKSVHECLSLIKSNITNFLIPINNAPPLIELFVFSDVSSIKKHIIGAPRGAVNNALNNPHCYFMCKCCKLDDPTSIIPELPDISIAYKLHLECGKMINLFDWLQSFKYVVDGSDDSDNIDPKTQARFTRVVSELEFLGFIKSTKRKTDHVSRLTW